MQEIKIDFDNPGFPQRLDVVENDAQSRFFKAVLYKDGKAYAAPSGATYSIMYRGFGPQNEGWYDTINDGAGKRAACSVSGNVVTCEIARQALRVPGHVSVMLCVTGSNGYMLHGWPIDCNCRNDSYTSGTSVESFFYITQVTNADWTSAIQTWEELKNMIDPTLSLSGKAADAKATGDAFKKCQIVGDNLIISADQISDFNDIKENSRYSLEILPSNPPKNIPTDYPLTGTTAYLETYNVKFPGSFTVQQKITFISKNYIYYREYVGSTDTWTAWSKMLNTSTVGNRLVSSRTEIEDFNAVTANSTYVLAILADNPPKNIPPDYPLTGTTAYLETYNVKFPGSFTVQQKITFISKNYIYYRECVGNTTKWTTWEKYYTKESTSGGQVKIYIGSTRKYKTLRAGLLEAVRHEGCEVYVDAETFDIIKEYGDTFFENFSSPTNEYGLALGNGIKVHFASGSKVVCNYTGSNHAINEEFSVFHVYASSQGFLLDNVTIEASNVRYCVHDEHGIDPTPYKNIYENCSMYINNTNNPVWGPDTPCIGGGLGKHGEIIVDSCVFEATSSTQRTGVVSYHNSSASGAKSNLIFKNNYFKGANSGLRFGYYGDSDEITNILIAGNSYTLAPYLRAENNSATKENMKMLIYNNELRT